jgi:hypothetical protein
MALATFLWITGSLIMLLLGSIHLFYTFFSGKFLPVSEGLHEQMEQTTMRLTRQTTMWKAWIGFNASHSIGAIYIGILNIFLAVQFPRLLRDSVFFPLFTIAVIGFYLWLAKKYWFKIPFAGLLITLACYVTSAVIALLAR